MLRQGSVSISLSRLLDLAPVLAVPFGVGGDQDPADGQEESAVANHRERLFLGALSCG